MANRINKVMFHVKASLLVMALMWAGAAHSAWAITDFFHPVARFAVLADPHFYDPDLGMEGEAFEQAMAQEVKLFRQSSELLETALLEIEQTGVDFLILPGDLTKDGERYSHLKLASYLKELKDRGIPSFVVPGNHDILNPLAFSYSEAGPAATPTIQPEEFEIVYEEFGYSDALYRDPTSLSYVVEPVPGLWLLAMDSCRYRENTDESMISGALKAETMEWIEQVLHEARARNKMTVGFLHHAVLENFVGHADLVPEFIVEDHEQVSRKLAEWGLELVFTGHTHVQDATARCWENGRCLLDIQTGSILTYPNPYRIVTLRQGFLNVRSYPIVMIPGDFGDDGFSAFSRAFTESGMRKLAARYLFFGALADFFVATYLAHAMGDEQPGEDTLLTIQRLKASPVPFYKTAGYYAESIWTDLPPADNDFLYVFPNRRKDDLGRMIQRWKTFCREPHR